MPVPFGFNPDLMPSEPWLAGDARQAAARRMLEATRRPVFQVHDPAKYAQMPLSQNIDDRRASDTVVNWLGGVVDSPSWEEIKNMLRNPLTPHRELVKMLYPQEASAYASPLAAQAGTHDLDNVGMLREMIQRIEPMMPIEPLPERR